MQDTLQKINDGLWIEEGAKFVLFIGKLGFTDNDRDVNIDDDGTKGDDQAVWQHAICSGEMNLLKDNQTGIPQQSDGLAIEVVLEVYFL